MMKMKKVRVGDMVKYKDGYVPGRVIRKLESMVEVRWDISEVTTNTDRHFPESLTKIKT